jgi:hypothetical protein
MADSADTSTTGWIDGDSDLRRYPRARVEGAVTSNPVPGEVIDTSEGGLGVRSHIPLHVGERNSFYLKKGSTRVKFRGEVRWCHFQDATKLDSGDVVPVYRSGIALLWPGDD